MSCKMEWRVGSHKSECEGGEAIRWSVRVGEPLEGV